MMDSFKYIAAYFDNSLAELATRNPHLKTQFRQRDANSFEAIIYSDGKQASKCGIWLGSGSFMKKAFPTAEYISIGDFQFTGSGQTNLVDPEENDPITIDGDLPALYVVLNYIHESLSR